MSIAFPAWRIVGIVLIFVGVLPLIRWGYLALAEYFKGGSFFRILVVLLVIIGAVCVAGFTIYIELNRVTTIKRDAPPPPATGISVKLVVTGASGADAVGYFRILNKTLPDVRIGEILQQVPSKFVGKIGAQMPRVVGRGETISLPLNRENGLAEVGIARLQFEFTATGFSPPKNPYLVQFELPLPIRPGVYDYTLCCDKPIDIDDAINTEGLRVFEEDSVGRAELSFNEAKGRSFLITADHERQFVFDPEHREVVFIIKQDGKQKVLFSPLQSTSTGDHFVRIDWNNFDGTAALTVDSVKAKPYKFGKP